ncbi:acyl-CoA dehydrogenase/oxidase [Ochromonadaceae sp. CCMP2298]|nr:acyl-CoA dehydrogenase/oxidase [Ochromonadaceae sp. CCMP2298]
MLSLLRAPRALARAHVRALSTATTTTTRPEPQCADSLLQIGTRRIFEHEHDQYRELCRRFYEKEVIPYHAAWEEEGQVPRELWKSAGENGLLCVTVPEEFGGMGLDVRYAAVHWEEMAYANTTGPGFFLHSEIVAPYLMHYGTQAQKEQYLPRLCTGEMISAIAMTEPGGGSDLASMRTTATRDGTDFILNGSKTYITNGWHSDLVIVCAKTDPSKGAKGISLFLLEAGTKGFSKGTKLKKMGMKVCVYRVCTVYMCMPHFNVCTLNGGFFHLMEQLPQERLLVANMALASAEACFEWTRTFVKDRAAFGKKLIDLQTIKHRLAAIKTEVSIGRTFADRCIELLSEGKLDNSTASMAKVKRRAGVSPTLFDCPQHPP